MKKNTVFSIFLFVLFLNLPLISTAQTANQLKVTVIHYDHITHEEYNEWNNYQLDSDQKGQYLTLLYSELQSELGASILEVYQMPDGSELTVEPLWTMEMEGGYVYTQLSDDGNRLFVINQKTNTTYCFRPNSSTPIWSTDIYHEARFKHLAISTDNAYLLIMHYRSPDLYLSLVNASNGNQFWNITTPLGPDGFESYSISDSNEIFCSYINGTVRAFDVEKNLLWETHDVGSELIMQRSGELMIAKDGLNKYYVLNSSNGGILRSKEFPGHNIWHIAMGNSGLDYVVSLAGVSEHKLMFMTRDSDEHRNEISVSSHIFGLYPITMDMCYLAAVTTKELIFIDSMTAEIVATRSYSDQLQTFHFSGPNEINGLGIFSERGQFLILSFEILFETDEPGLTDLSILDQIVEAFLNRNNWIALGITLFVGLLIGGLIFRRKKE